MYLNDGRNDRNGFRVIPIIHWNCFNRLRRRWWRSSDILCNVNNVYDLITNIPVGTIVKFFEEINLYAKIYGFIFLKFLLFVSIIRLFYRQVCFISKCLVCV